MNRIGPYILGEILGAGAMGVVYRAQHHASSETVALKTLQGARATALGALRREVRALARLDHPGIVRIVDHGIEDGLPWYAMELLRGRPLREMLAGTASPTLFDGARDRTGAFDPIEPTAAPLVHTAHALTSDIVTAEHPEPLTPDADDTLYDTAPADLSGLPYFCQLCDTLAYLHSAGLVHRDLKPDNIMVLDDERVVLVDFGISVQALGATGRERMTAPHTSAGTITYMAPEQIEGGWVDARADLYALGCMLFEAICGRLPFLAATPVELMLQHISAEPPHPTQLAPDIPPPLATLILELLAKPPTQRPGYAEDIALRLAPFLPPGNAYTPPNTPPRARLYRPSLAGRSQSLKALKTALQNTKHGQGQLHLIAGESGMGKTRLALELITCAKAERMRVETGPCKRGLDGQNALHPLRPLLQHLADTCAEQPHLYPSLLGRAGPILAPFEPTIAALPDVQKALAPEPLPPREARLRALVALNRVLFQIAARKPLLLVLDDIQWADPWTLQWLELLARTHEQDGESSQTPLMVLGLLRAEALTPDIEKLASHPVITTHRLGRLDTGAIAQMVSSMLAMPTVPSSLLTFLSHHAEGNPFFVAEYLRTAVSEGILTRDTLGEWHLNTHDAHPLGLPTTLPTLVHLRYQHLPQAIRDTACYAAILGREVPPDMLASETHTDILIEHSILEYTPTGALRFVHDKLREILLDGLLPAQRQRLHQEAAEALQTRDDIDPAQIASHLAAAGVQEEARRYFIQAAENAAKRYDLDAALELFDSAIELQGDALSQESVHARLRRARLLLEHGRGKPALTQAETAFEEANVLREAPLTAQCLLLLGRVLHILQDERAMTYLEAARPLLQELGDRAGEAERLGLIANIERDSQDPKRVLNSVDLFEQILTLYRELGDRRQEGITLNNLALSYKLLDYPDRARTLFAQAFDIHLEVGNRLQAGITLNNIAISFRDSGDYPLSIQYYEQALDIHREVGNPRSEAIALGNLAVNYRELGDHARAYSLYHRALALHREVGNASSIAITLSNMGLSLQERGEFERARAIFQDALARMRALGRPRLIGGTLTLLGKGYLTQGRFSEALDHLERALALHRETGNSLFAAHTLQHLARIHRLRGQLYSVSDLLEQAEAYFAVRDFPLYRGLLLCEKAHFQIAIGGDPTPLLEQASQLAQTLGLGSESALSRSLRTLESAIAAHHKGQPMVHGESVETLSPGLKEALTP